jgi:hypothetical protein
VQLGLQKRACHDHLPEGPGSPCRRLDVIHRGTTWARGAHGVSTDRPASTLLVVSPPADEQPDPQPMQAGHETVHDDRHGDRGHDERAKDDRDVRPKAEVGRLAALRRNHHIGHQVM